MKVNRTYLIATLIGVLAGGLISEIRNPAQPDPWEVDIANGKIFTKDTPRFSWFGLGSMLIAHSYVTGKEVDMAFYTFKTPVSDQDARAATSVPPPAPPQPQSAEALKPKGKP